MSDLQGGYVPPPSIGHELGIMFGFLAIMALCMLAYVISWQYFNKVGRRKEAERIENLKASGWLKEKQEPEEERTEDKGQEISM